MVRLKAQENTKAFRTFPLFQFHNGSIKRSVGRGVERLRQRFNSQWFDKSYLSFTNQSLSERFQFHNGSIKRMSHKELRDALAKFQFHNGSIKRLFGAGRMFLATMFQFHNGSIKR